MVPPVRAQDAHTYLRSTHGASKNRQPLLSVCVSVCVTLPFPPVYLHSLSLVPLALTLTAPPVGSCRRRTEHTHTAVFAPSAERGMG